MTYYQVCTEAGKTLSLSSEFYKICEAKLIGQLKLLEDKESKEPVKGIANPRVWVKELVGNLYVNLSDDPAEAQKQIAILEKAIDGLLIT